MEIMLGLAILGVTLAIAIPSYQRYLEKTRIAEVISDMRSMEIVIQAYNLDYGEYPPNLAAVGLDGTLDPWDNPYGYLRDPYGNRNRSRKDGRLNPINDDFDLYSMGPDGQSRPPLNAAASRDDIVRANNGNYMGLAADY